MYCFDVSASGGSRKGAVAVRQLLSFLRDAQRLLSCFVSEGARIGRRTALHRCLRCELLESRTLLSAVSTAAYPLLSDRVEADQSAFYVYLDGDSGLNHGFPSGKFASNNDTTLIDEIGISTLAVYDASSPTGTTTDPNSLDRVRGNVLQITFPALSAGQFVGLNLQEPEDDPTRGTGYDLTGATQVVFDAASPTPGMKVQFGVGGKVTDQSNFYSLSSNFQTISINLSTLRDPNTNLVSPPDLSTVHVLFGVATNEFNCPSGGTVLLDNIRFTPVPAAQAGVPSLPLDTQTFGAMPVLSGSPQQSIPPDQANRNISSIYSDAITEIALLNGGTTSDLSNARQIADGLVYALNHDNSGDSLPTASADAGLHNAYSSGDLPLLNDQVDPKTKLFDWGLQGQDRLAGFSGPSLSGGTTPDFYLVLDDATGGNNAFAVLALTAAYREFGDSSYLDAAREIGRWITSELTDTSGTGYGGYFVGYPDEGVVPKTLETGKLTENNADIFAAFTTLASIETSLGNTAEANDWTARANVAGDFVEAMLDPTGSHFYAGTVPASANPGPGPGFDPTGPQKGNDIINKYDFLDSDSFTTLAMASAPRYSQINWRLPVQYIVDHFAETITAGGQTYEGFDIVAQPTAVPGDHRTTPSPNGVSWEFTGQAVEVMRYVDAVYGENRFESLANSYLARSPPPRHRLLLATEAG